MCFSAEASFTVGSALGVIGIIAWKKVTDWSLRGIALIPLLFALQQFGEGMVWIEIGKEKQLLLSSFGQQIFLVIAWVVWPTYVPLVILLAEKIFWRKAACMVCLAIGLLVSVIDGNFIVTHPVAATLVGCSIQYTESPLYQSIFYAAAIIPPFFISSVHQLWVFGLWLSISFAISQIIWKTTFTSVWCFFAAACSLILLKILAKQKQSHRC